MTDLSNPQPPSHHTEALHNAASAMINFDDPADFARAERGLIAQHETGLIDVDGWPVWDTSTHDFLRTGEPAPASVHPGLWRQGQLNSLHGLFEVADGVWQVRGYDISNITFMAGDDGWLIIDPLTTPATAAAALALANATLCARPVTTVIYTHSHVDHYGGVEGVITQDQVDAGDVRVVAPVGFLDELVSENAIAGPIMARRAHYQFGPFLPPGVRGQVDCGLGQKLPLGRPGLIAPTDIITETGQEMILSGIPVVFQNTPDAEAPAEMNFFFPDKKLLCMAENCSHNIHNLYPIRGAKTRSALAWSKYLHEALTMWGADTDTMFASHHWPRFGNADVQGFLALQRDVYRWMHDQTMRLANHGYVPTEISAELSLPESFDQSHVRGYYGTVSHNVRSVYNLYLGWYDANPANLDPLPPADAGARYVEAMGGADSVLATARTAFEKGDYRWVVTLVNHLVFSDPTNQDARHLQADALEQLGYQAESGTWRNAYLSGARELRLGTPDFGAMPGRNIAAAMQASHIFDVMGVRFDPARFDPTGHQQATINWRFVDLQEDHVLGIANAALHHSPHQVDPDASASITLDRDAVFSLIEDVDGLDRAVESGSVSVVGDLGLVKRLLEAFDSFGTAAIIEP